MINEVNPEQALEEIVQEEQGREQKQEQLREQLAQVLLKRRDQAVRYRAGLGIETQWAEDQAYYEGEEESSRVAYYKGMTLGSPLLAKPKNDFKSKIFLNITRPYVETAASKVIEVLCPVDDRAFSIVPSPIPFAVMGGQEMRGMAIPQETSAPAMPEQGAPPMVDQNGMPAAPQQIQQQQAEKSVEDNLRIAARGAERWIDDALQECGYGRELRRLVDDAARLGTGIMRGPIPTVRVSRKVEGDQLIMVEEIVPESKCISIWNAFPDPACGDNIHNGQYFIEHDNLTEKQVRELIAAPGYIPSAIEEVLRQGPQENATTALVKAPHESSDQAAKNYHIWYYHGFLSVEDVVAMGCACGEVEGGVAAVITIINDTPVKAHLAPLSAGKFPYDFMCWQRTAGSPWGIGIARQIRACQSILNATVRSMMENAGLSSGPQIILGRGSIIPADGSWVITPRKVWLLKPDADIPDVTKAFNAVQIPSIQQELLETVNFVLKMAENVTGLPILLQGQQGPTGVPETVGGMQILVANASGLLRRMARIFDDSITKPHVTSYYEWMMEFGEDDSIKGDFQVIPRGSSALVIKDMRATFLIQVVPQLIANPNFGIDPSRYFKEVAKLNGLEPSDVQFTEAELQALMQQEAPPDPRVQVAQIRTEGDLKKTEMVVATDQARIARDIDRDTMYVQAENERTKTTSATKMAELELRRELAMLEYANKHQVTVEQIKAKLATEGAKMDLQRELAQFGHISAQEARVSEAKLGTQQAVVEKAVEQVATPAVEPPGRAPNGQGFAL
jgi:hypothetical protein